MQQAVSSYVTLAYAGLSFGVDVQSIVPCQSYPTVVVAGMLCIHYPCKTALSLIDDQYSFAQNVAPVDIPTEQP